MFTVCYINNKQTKSSLLGIVEAENYMYICVCVCIYLFIIKGEGGKKFC